MLCSMMLLLACAGAPTPCTLQSLREFLLLYPLGNLLDGGAVVALQNCQNSVPEQSFMAYELAFVACAGASRCCVLQSFGTTVAVQPCPFANVLITALQNWQNVAPGASLQGLGANIWGTMGDLTPKSASINGVACLLKSV